MSEPRLKTVYWTVTRECNQRCSHCWISAGTRREGELNTEESLQIFNVMVDMGLEQVKLTGGEPLLQWKKINTVMEFLIDHGVQPRIETNATLIQDAYGEEILSFLEKNHVHVAVSLDSHIPQQHDQFRGMKGGFEKTLSALTSMRSHNISFSIVTVLHRENRATIDEIVDFVREIYPRHHQINIITPEGRAENNDRYQLPIESYVEDLPLLIKKIRKKMGEKVSFAIPYVFAPLNTRFLNCTVGKEICGLLPNGDIAMCGAGINREDLVLGNALRDDIEDIWLHSPVFMTLRRGITSLKGVCSNCWFAQYCMGHCRAYAYSVYGQLEAPYPMCQTVYEQGAFPEKYLVHPERDCSYVPPEG
ncbi:MAG: radical SAM protein [Theionarchaea archaeon]|nr:radical SAM protein [Theionarchaea archaeon]